jgi:hypothetical protein
LLPIGYNAGMTRFSLKQLFAAVTLVSLGIGALIFCHRIEPETVYNYFLWFISIPLIIAGVASLNTRWPVGAMVLGFFAGVFLQIFIFCTNLDHRIGGVMVFPYNERHDSAHSPR